MYYEVHDVIKLTKNIRSVNSINSGCITNYVMCSNGCVCDVISLCSTSINTFHDFLTLFNRYRKKRKIMKDEEKLHGVMDKSLSEQQFHKSDTITFVV